MCETRSTTVTGDGLLVEPLESFLHRGFQMRHLPGMWRTDSPRGGCTRLVNTTTTATTATTATGTRAGLGQMIKVRATKQSPTDTYSNDQEARLRVTNA